MFQLLQYKAEVNPFATYSTGGTSFLSHSAFAAAILAFYASIAVKRASLWNQNSKHCCHTTNTSTSYCCTQHTLAHTHTHKHATHTLSLAVPHTHSVCQQECLVRLSKLLQLYPTNDTRTHTQLPTYRFACECVCARGKSTLQYTWLKCLFVMHKNLICSHDLGQPERAFVWPEAETPHWHVHDLMRIKVLSIVCCRVFWLSYFCLCVWKGDMFHPTTCQLTHDSVVNDAEPVCKKIGQY